MISTDLFIYLLIALPLMGTGLCALTRSSRLSLLISIAVAAAELCAGINVLVLVHQGGRLFAANGFLFIDPLSAYHLCLVAAIFLLASLYALRYFADRGTVPRNYSVLWNAFFSVLISSLCANNIGFLWIAIEASTLFSALLIATEGKPASVEAMWKYLLICSVGIALAFVGTLLLSVAAQAKDCPILWTSLVEHAGTLDQTVLLLAFLFVLVGFGTKAGLAPMHTWLPDAHSQAPTPVSTVFSGVMLNVALYCILRYLPILDNGNSLEGHRLLLGFGILSMIIAAVFIPAQSDIKRLLAYCSVEHIGIIAIGIGLGGFGTAAALFHTVNHSFSKTLAFFSAGRLAARTGSYDMHSLRGSVAANPLWGIALLTALLALIGMAPFSVFMSEFQIVKSAVESHRYFALGLFLITATIIFISILRRAISISFGEQALESTPAPEPRIPAKNFPVEWCIVVFLVAALLTAGLCLPQSYLALLTKMAAIINHPAAPGVLP